MKVKTYEDIKLDLVDIPKAKPSTALPAAKHFDMVMGIDIHFVRIPPAPAVPMPHPHVGIVFDIMEMLPPILMPSFLIKPLGAIMGVIAPLSQNMFGPGQASTVHQVKDRQEVPKEVVPDTGPVDPDAGPWAPPPTVGIGANVFINGMRRAQVSTDSKIIPFHIPLGVGFSFPSLVKHKGESFLGSRTVAVEGMPFPYMGLPFLSCQCIGMPSPGGNIKKPKKSGMFLPTAIVMPIPIGKPVNVGGPPVPHLSPLGAFKAFRKFQKGSKAFKKLSQKLNKLFNKKGKNWLNKAICTATGHPVDVASGKFFTDKVDFELPGPIPINWERSYYSCSDYEGPMGHGWHHSYDIFLTPLKDDPALILNTPDGRDVFVPELKVGGLHYDRTEKIIFFRDEDSYGYRTNEHHYYRFSKHEIEGRFILKEINTKSGHAITFKHDALGNLIQIIDSAGRALEVENDDYGRLNAIHVPHPKVKDERIYLVRYEYDSQNRMIKTLDALDQFMVFEYDGTYMVRETDRNGLSFYFEYDLEGRCYHTWGDGGIYNHHLDFYDGYTVVTNSLGAKTTYDYNDAGVVTKITEPNDGVTEMEYNEFYDLLMETDPEGQSTSYTYDQFGNQTGVLKPDGALTSIKYQQNLPIVIKDPMGNVNKLAYDENGDLIQLKSNNITTDYVYENGLLKTIEKGDQKTSLFYDNQKNLIQTIAPDNSKFEWKFDSLGRCISTTDAKKNAYVHVFDKLGQLLQVTEDGNKIKYSYDGEGNVVQAKDNSKSIAFEYSGLGRLVSRMENNTRVSFGYNTEEDLLQIINEADSDYSFHLNENGEITREIGFDGLTRHYERNKAGKVEKVVRPDGTVTEYTYDGAGRLSLIEQADGKQEYYIYRGDGFLVEAGNEDAILQLFRDKEGNVLKESVNGYEVNNAYNNSGQRISLETNLGGKVSFSRDAFGQLTDIQAENSEKIWKSHITRDIYGMEIERSLPGGLRSRWRRDKLGRPIQHSVFDSRTTKRERHYTWTPNEKLKEILNPQKGVTRFDYDAFGSLASAQYPDGEEQFKSPDNIGNIYRTKERTDRVYGKGGELIQSKEATYEYDKEGNLIRKTESDGRIWDYEWQSSGMLSRVIRPDNEIVSFKYDPLGRRISKTFQGQTTYWLWDGNVPIHEWKQDSTIPTAGVDENGELKAILPKENIQWIFEDGFTPVGKIENGKAYSIISDHLGTPTELYDEQGEKVWSCELDIYGKVRSITGDKEACPFRYQGQYEDVETGLYYNRFRYYDADGVYISQDPIGLNSGEPNFYAYVTDSNNYIDPLGLSGRGGSLHQSIQNQLVKDLGSNARIEGKIDLGNGKSRFGDVVVRNDAGKIIEVHQVGDMRSRGGFRPSSRERGAIEDIRHALGDDVKIVFHDKKQRVTLIDPDKYDDWKSPTSKHRKIKCG